VPNYFPAARIGYGNYVYVYEDGIRNWYGLLAITANDVLHGCFGTGETTSIPVMQAYNIDKKIDDGLPISGSVIANYVNCVGGGIQVVAATNNTSDNALTCYNNTSNTYSTGYNNGSGPNCALSFRMQQ
jgi:hypothetical protein